ncbi:helix-turn-helix transcriptional regulator [Streptomyces sp. NPDC001054]
MTEIAEEHGVSRQTIHAYRRRGTFPQPVSGEGSTRLRFRAEEVDAFFAANPKQPGKRTDLTPQPPKEEPRVTVKTYTLTMRIQADHDVTPEQIGSELYDAAEDVPFGFDITGIEETDE